MQEQKEICINNVTIPIIQEDNVNWFPISYIGSKVLLKELSPVQLRKNGYGTYIKLFNINFWNQGKQDAYCINQDGLKEILLNCRLGRLSVEQKISMKTVCDYIDLKLDIDTEELFLNSYPEEKWRQYDFWSAECIESILKELPNVKWQRCSKCKRYYPYIENFFPKEGNPNNKCELRTICKICKSWSDTRARIKMYTNKEFFNIYSKYGKDTYLLFKSCDAIKIWEWCNKNKYNHIPNIFKDDKNKILEVLLYLYNNKIILDQNLQKQQINKIFGYDIFKYGLTLKEVYKHLTGIEIKDKDGIGITLFEDAKKVFLAYLNKNNITITYDYDLWNLIGSIGLRIYLEYNNNNDILDFVLRVFDYKYFSYKFKGGYKVYWTNENNRLIALRQLIEEDMKIPIAKIPLYLTLENMNKQSNTMRNVLRKYYNNNIFLWVDKLYPNMFNEQDFNISVIRHIFDSAEESMIHDILVNRFKNVLYNQRWTENTITIKNMQPDWFVFTDNGIWIVEYFGINIEHIDYNKRITDYKNKTLSKIEKYKELNWLRKIYIYPEDLKNNFAVLNTKLNEIE